MSEMNVENVVEQLMGRDIETSDRLLLFVTLCDADKLLKELKAQAMMMNVGMVPETLVHSFAYGVLKIARPELFSDG